MLALPSPCPLCHLSLYAGLKFSSVRFLCFLLSFPHCFLLFLLCHPSFVLTTSPCHFLLSEVPLASPCRPCPSLLNSLSLSQSLFLLLFLGSLQRLEPPLEDGCLCVCFLCGRERQALRKQFKSAEKRYLFQPK